MTIVYVCAEYSYADQPTGGFGTYVKQLTAEISKRHQVIIVCEGETKKIIKKDEITIFVITPPFNWLISKLAKSHIPFLSRYAAFFLYPLGFSLTTAATLFKLQKERFLDVIEGGDFGAELFFYLLFRRGNVPPVIIKCHTPSKLIQLVNQEKKTIFYRVLGSLESFCFKHANGLYSPSKSLATLIDKLYGVSFKTVIPYPFKLKKITPSTFKKERLVLYVGKLQSKKGVFVFAQAISNLVAKGIPTQFAFIGPDTHETGRSVKRKLMSDFVKRNILEQIIFKPALNKMQLVNWYQRAAIVVVPSLWENFPNVVFEAIQYGCAIVASKVGGIAEMIGEKEAILVKPNNSIALAEGIERLLGNANQRRTLSFFAKKRVRKEFNPPSIAAKTIAFYQQILRESRAE